NPWYHKREDGLLRRFAPRNDDAKQEWPGSLPAISHSARRLSRRRNAGRRRRQRGIAAGEQRRNAADGDAPVDAARSRRLLLQILRAVALRGQVLRRDPELLRQQLGGRLRAPVRQRQIVGVVAGGIGVALDQEHLARIALDGLVESVRDRLQLRGLV